MTEPAFPVPMPFIAGDPAQQIKLFTALAKVQAGLPTIAKGREAHVEMKGGGTYSYDYADLSDVTEAIMPKLAAVDLAWICLPTWEDGRTVLRYALAHTGGGMLVGQYPLNLSGSPQASGSAITYARRYCLCAVVGVAPKGDDDDATTAGRQTAQRRTPAQRPANERARPRPATPPAGTDAQGAAQPAPEPWSPGQRSRIMASFTDAGIADRDERLDITGRIVGRELSSSNDLTYAEAGKVIETLEAARADEDGFSGWLARLMAGSPAEEETP